jgi:glycosyltransferase involved in cell wall biosynthesis
MRIAVIIPVYNHARYVGEAIESVLAQTARPARILCVDDGSTDDSLAVCQRYSSQGVHARGRENRGAHNTINELVQWASDEGCDWVNILNSDDRFLPRRIQACYEFAKRNPRTQVICGRLEVIDDQSNVMPLDAKRARWFYGAQSLAEKDSSNIAELLGKSNFIATTSNIFARTDYLLANPFRPYRYNHDYYFLAAAAWRDVIGLVPEVLMQYRIHGSNTITTKPELLMREMLRMHLDLFHDFAGELTADPFMRARFSDYCRALWDNISSFHAGMFSVALAQIVVEFSEEELKELAYSLQGEEFMVSPNRSLAAAYTDDITFSNGSLSAKLDLLRDEKTRWSAEREAWNELLRIKQLLQDSHWVGLGAAVGWGKTLRKNEGKGAIEKLQKMRNALLQSRWLKLGASLGSGTARKLRSEALEL